MNPFDPWIRNELPEETAVRAIIASACAIYNVNEGDLYHRRRSVEADMARTVAMGAAYDFLRDWTAERIARRFRKAAHSTITRARDRCNTDLREEYLKFKAAILTHPAVLAVATMYGDPVRAVTGKETIDG